MTGRALTELIRLRAYQGTLAEVDKVAKEEQRTRSDMLRLLIAEGLKTYRRRHEMRRP